MMKKRRGRWRGYIGQIGLERDWEGEGGWEIIGKGGGEGEGDSKGGIFLIGEVEGKDRQSHLPEISFSGYCITSHR